MYTIIVPREQEREERKMTDITRVPQMMNWLVQQMNADAEYPLWIVIVLGVLTIATIAYGIYVIKATWIRR